MSFFNYFTDSERGAAARATGLKNRVFGRLGPLLVRLRVHPDSLSYVGLAMLPGVVIWFLSHPFRAVALLVLYVVIDGLDGSYARYLDRPTQSGAFTDIVVDQLGMVVIALGFIQHRMVDGQVGAYYIMIYLIMIAFSVIQNAQGIPMQYIFRSKYILYGIYTLWAITRVNLAPYLMPLFCLVMTVSVVQSFLRLKRGIFWKYDFPVIQAHDQEVRAGGGTPPRFWQPLNMILPGLVVLFLLFAGAYTQIVAMVETADLAPKWIESPELPLMDGQEEPRAVASWREGWLVSAYNPQSRFSRIYYLDAENFSVLGSFRVSWALHRDHGACADQNSLYIADRLSARVFDLDLEESMARGVAVINRSFDTTLRAPVGCALVDVDGKKVMLVAEYMNLYRTLAVDYEKAFAEGTAAEAVVGWYRNAGFSRGIASESGWVLEMNSSLWKDLIYVSSARAALADNYFRAGLTEKLAAPEWRCRDLAVRGDVIALVDGESRKLYMTRLPDDVSR